MLLAVVAWAVTPGKRIVWQEDAGKVFTGWADKQQITAAELGDVSVGDILTVHVSEINPETTWPQVHLRTYAGKAFDPAKSQSVKGKTAPCEVAFELDEAAVAAAGEAGLSIAGIGFAADKVSVTPKEPEEPAVDPIEVPVTKTLWSGEQTVVGWSGAQTFTAAACKDFKAGDVIVVTVSAVSGESSQVDLRNGAGWANFEPAVSEVLTGKETPLEVTFTLTEDVAAVMRANGMVVTGCNFTFTKVERRTTELTLPSTAKGEAARTVWEGMEAISWVSGSSNSVLVSAADLGKLVEGNVVRVYYKDMKPGGIGRMLAGWTALEGQSNATLLGARYFECTLSAANVSAIAASGLRISGNNYTAVKVEIIDPAKKYLIISEIDRNDIRAWEKGESSKITLSLQNAETVDVEAVIEVDVDEDCYVDYTEISEKVTLGAGATKEVTVPFSLVPGFYNLNVYVNGDNVCSYVIGSEPKNVVSAPDSNLAEIKAYWDNELAILKNIPMDAELTEIPSASTANRRVYLVKMKSTPDTWGGEPVEIRGFYAEPTADGKYPAIIQYQGTDGGTSAVTPINGDDNIGWCELVISTRGQMLNNRSADNCQWAWLDPAYAADREASGSNKIDYYAHGLYDKEKHYYRGANMDCIRAIDFIASREKTNDDNIFAVGGSQGGSFVYVAAALGEGRIRACAPSITGHSDFRDGSRIVNWPKSVFDKYLAEHSSVTEEELYEFLSFYDVMNLATFVECPVYTSFSLQDRTDPPHINVAPFNNVPRDKVGEDNLRYVVNPFLGHGTASDWKTQYMGFFNSYRTDLDPTDPGEDLNLWKGECVTGNWEGYQILGTDLFTSVKAGDFIEVSVSEVGDSPVLMLNNGSWGALVDADAKVPAAGEVVSFLITPDMLAELKSGGVVVKGCNMTFVSVDIRRGTEIKPEGPDAAVRRLWTGESAIDWNKGSYVSVAASKFECVKEGETLRFVYTGLMPGAQAHLNCGWTAAGAEIALPGGSEYMQLKSASYSVKVSSEMLVALKNNGLNVLGVGHTLLEVQAIDYSRLPDVEVSFDENNIRHFVYGEEAVLALTLTNKGSEDADVDVSLALRHDDYTIHAKYGLENKTVMIPAGESAEASFALTLDPGVYHFVATANYLEVADANIAFDLEGIESDPDAQTDFEDFWRAALGELGAVAPEYSMTRLDEYSTDKRAVYMVEMKSVADAIGGNPVTVRGYYAEPVAPGMYKAVITYQGYDSNPETQQYIPHGDANPDRIDFVLSTRGQGINNRGDYKAENEYYGDWFMFGFGNKDTFYYRGAYMDAVRAFDFVSSREKTDTDNIFGEGHSQGGALTYAAAALVAMRNSMALGSTPAFNAIAPAIPFMGDFPDYFRIGSWPSTPAYNWLNAQSAVSEEQMYEFLSYFDTKNLAQYVDCHVLTAVGLQDETCPAHTNIAPFNVAKRNTSKEASLIVNPLLGHQVHQTWNNELNAFFDKHLVDSTTSAELIGDGNGSISVKVDGNAVYVIASAETTVVISDLAGRTVYCGNDDKIQLDNTGLYILSAGSYSTKLIVK